MGAVVRRLTPERNCIIVYKILYIPPLEGVLASYAVGDLHGSTYRSRAYVVFSEGKLRLGQI